MTIGAFQTMYYLLASSIGTLVNTINTVEALKVLCALILLVLVHAVLFTKSVSATYTFTSQEFKIYLQED